MSILWSELKSEIMDKYDLNEETFVDTEEMLAYINDAIEDIESEIHCINDKYFETEGFLELVSDTDSYALPSDIYATKITGVYYNDGARKYEITPIRNKADILDINANDDYRYRLVNSTAGGVAFKLYPPSRESSTEVVTIHYIRSCKKIELESDLIDLPDASKSFLKQYVIDQAANKERMTPDAQESPALQRKRASLIEILTDMVPDDNNQIDCDFSYYQDLN